MGWRICCDYIFSFLPGTYTCLHLCKKITAGFPVHYYNSGFAELSCLIHLFEILPVADLSLGTQRAGGPLL
jgi:hypothetical protein